MDSKSQFRDARPPATANSAGRVHSMVNGGRLEPPKQLYRFAEADDRSGDIAAPAIDRRNPTEASKPLPILPGTKISSPFASSAESADFQSLNVYFSPESQKRQLLTEFDWLS